MRGEGHSGLTPRERALLQEWLDTPPAERPQGHPAAQLLAASAAARAYAERLARLDQALAAAFAASVPEAAKVDLKRRIAGMARKNAPAQHRRPSCERWDPRRTPWTWTLLPAAACLVLCAVMLWRSRPPAPVDARGRRDLARASGIVAEPEPSPPEDVVRGSEARPLAESLPEQPAPPLRVDSLKAVPSRERGGRAGSAPAFEAGRAFASAAGPAAPQVALAETQQQVAPTSAHAQPAGLARAPTPAEQVPVDAVWRVSGAPEQWDTLNTVLNREPGQVRLLSANVPAPEPDPAFYERMRPEPSRAAVAEQAPTLAFGYQAGGEAALDRGLVEEVRAVERVARPATRAAGRAVPEMPAAVEAPRPEPPGDAPDPPLPDPTSHLLANLGLLAPAPVDLAMAGDSVAPVQPQWLIQGTQAELETLRGQLSTVGLEVREAQHPDQAAVGIDAIHAKRAAPQFLNVIVLWDQPPPVGQPHRVGQLSAPMPPAAGAPAAP